MFRFFRRNQKFLIVVGGVILMFVFLVGDYLPQILGNSDAELRGSPNATLASWDGGKLTHAQYEAELQKRQILNQFIRNVVGMGQQKAMARGIEEPLLSVVPIGVLPEEATNDQIRAQVVSDRMLADMARKRGMRVSREALQSYIAKLGQNELSSDELTSLVNISARVKVSGDYVLDALEDQFLAKMMLSFYGVESDFFLLAEMPYDRWETWRYVNDLVSIEAAALNIDDFRIDVPEPTEAQLKELYEQYKDVVPHPVTVEGVTLPNPNPAFAIPRKIALQYLHANYEESVERIKAQVTDEEIKEFYEKNKGLYSKAESFDDFNLFDDEAEQKPEVEPENPADESAASETREEMENTPEEGAVEGESPAAEPESQSPEGENPPADEPAASDEPAEGAGPQATETPADPPAETPAAPEEGGTPANDAPAEPEGTAAIENSPLEFVSFQSEGEEGQESSASDDQATGAEGSPAAPAEGEASGDESAESTASEQETPAAEESTPSETPAGEPAAKEPEYEPLEKVTEDVRRRIAEQRYGEEIDAKVSTILGRLRTASREYRRQLYAAEAEGKPAPKPPEELADLTKLAEEFGLAYEKTEPLDMFEMLDETEVGSAYEVDDFVPVRNLMFSDRLSLYQPVEAQSFGGGKFGDRYIVMKTSDTPGRTPSFEEVKDQVREAWIRREAAKVALKRAEEYAAKAKEAGQTLKDFFEGNERVQVVETNSFSRYTQGEAASAGSLPSYKLSQPEGIKNAGPQFMEKVFALDADDVGAVLNFDESIAYVIRVANPIETEESLQGSFLASANSWDGRLAFQRAAAQGRAQEIYAKLRQQFNIEFAEDKTSDEEE